jgi:AcrR family transcriptional regulator
LFPRAAPAAVQDPRMSAPVSAEPRVGRPRDPSRDVAIVQATLELLSESGFGALTMEAVAARAGVGKATLYRRYAGKDQLVIDALARLTEPAEPAVGASVRDQLVTLLQGTQRRADSLAGRIFPRLISEAMENPELLRAYRQQVLDPRRRRFRDVLRRGVDEGLLRPDLDLEHAVDLLVGPVAYRNLLRTDPPAAPDFVMRVVDDVLDGLRPRPVRQERA